MTAVFATIIIIPNWPPGLPTRNSWIAITDRRRQIQISREQTQAQAVRLIDLELVSVPLEQCLPGCHQPCLSPPPRQGILKNGRMRPAVRNSGAPSRTVLPTLRTSPTQPESASLPLSRLRMCLHVLQLEHPRVRLIGWMARSNTWSVRTLSACPGDVGRRRRGT